MAPRIYGHTQGCKCTYCLQNLSAIPKKTTTFYTEARPAHRQATSSNRSNVRVAATRTPSSKTPLRHASADKKVNIVTRRPAATRSTSEGQSPTGAFKTYQNFAKTRRTPAAIQDTWKATRTSLEAMDEVDSKQPSDGDSETESMAGSDMDGEINATDSVPASSLGALKTAELSYAELPRLVIQDAVEEALLATLSVEEFDLVMDDISGLQPVDYDVENADLICILREGIDERNTNLGLPPLGELYPKRSPTEQKGADPPEESPPGSPAALKVNKIRSTSHREAGSTPMEKTATKADRKQRVTTKPTPPKPATTPHGNVKPKYPEQLQRGRGASSRGARKTEQSRSPAWWEKASRRPN